MRRSTLSAVLISIIVLSTIVVYSAEAAGIPKKAISTVARFLETDLPTTTVFTDQANTFNAGLKQIFQASGTNAGINVAGVSSDPSSLSQGDVWYNSGSINALKFSASGGTQTIAAYTGSCSNNQVLVYSTSTNTWSCGSNGVASINSDTTAAQTIQGVSGNTTVSTSSGTTTINTGQNVVLTGGSAQTINKTLTMKGGAITTSTCSNGQFLKYQISNHTWICGNAMTSINTSTVASQTIQGSGNNVTVNTVIGTGITTVATGTNIVVKDHPNTYSAGQTQTFQASGTTAGMNFAGVSSNPSSPSPGDLWRNTSLDDLFLRGASSNYVLKTNNTLAEVLNPTNQTAMTASASPIMLGLPSAVTNPTTFTPTLTGRVLVTISYDVVSTVNNKAFRAQIAYGSGTLPTHSGAAAGTTIGSKFFVDPIGNNVAFGQSSSRSVVISGLTPGTTYWVDLEVWDASTAMTFTDVTVTINEI